MNTLKCNFIDFVKKQIRPYSDNKFDIDLHLQIMSGASDIECMNYILSTLVEANDMNNLVQSWEIKYKIANLPLETRNEFGRMLLEFLVSYAKK